MRQVAPNLVAILTDIEIEQIAGGPRVKNDGAPALGQALSASAPSDINESSIV